MAQEACGLIESQVESVDVRTLMQIDSTRLPRTGRTGLAIILVVALSVVGLSGCAGALGEPLDVSDYCYEETPKDWDYCDWYYEESTRCWMCNPGQQ